MGCFNGKCVVSGLPIECGTAVRYLALTGRAEVTTGKGICYAEGRWQIRTPPVRAFYNDYGSIENATENLAYRVFFGSFDTDAVEKGPGDNLYHDVEIKRGMKPDAWLEALWEGRVFVRDYEPWKMTGEEKRRSTSEEPEKLPTMSRVEKALKEAGLKLSTERSAPGYVVDEITRGFIRVRPTAYGGKVGPALDALIRAGFSAIETACSSHYDLKSSEILIVPPPGVHAGQTIYQRIMERERPVAQVMVREDVWQIMLETPIRSWLGQDYTLATFKEAGRQLLKEDAEKEARRATWTPMEKFKDEMDMAMGTHGENLIQDAIATGGCEGIYGFALRQSYKLARTLAKDPAELEAFMDDLAETCFVRVVMGHLEAQWQPSTNNGQGVEWQLHHDFHAKLSQVKGKWEDERLADAEESETVTPAPTPKAKTKPKAKPKGKAKKKAKTK